jgi:hypothetical protein
MNGGGGGKKPRDVMKAQRERRRWAGHSRQWVITGAAIVLAGVAAERADAAVALLQLRLSGRVLPVAGDLSVVVRVEPNDENRNLTVFVDCGEYMRSSSEQLEGADAARAHQFWFKHLPAGQYELVARLDGTTGTRDVASSNFVVGTTAPAGR